jgi:hypothetical protein
MSLSELANAENPIEAILELAMKELGAEATDATIQTYSSLLEDAIRMNDGDNPEQWGDFLTDLTTDDYFDAAVKVLAESVGASSSQAVQFIRLTDAVIDIKSGVPEEKALATFQDELESIEPTEPEPYAHFDDESRDSVIEFEKSMAEADPDRPEPQPFVEEDADNGEF